MAKYFRRANNMAVGEAVTAAMVTDSNMDRFLTFVWKNWTTKEQVKKVQSYFLWLRGEYKLPSPDSKGDNEHYWSQFKATLKGLQKEEAWHKPQKHKICLDEEQDQEIVSKLVAEVDKAPAEAGGRLNLVVLLDLVVYLILTDTASRPELIHHLMSDGVKMLVKGDVHEGKRLKSRVVWLHTPTSKNLKPMDKYMACSCPEMFSPDSTPCSQNSCGYNVLKTYQSLIPFPNSPDLKFMRNFVRRKKVEVGYMGITIRSVQFFTAVNTAVIMFYCSNKF